MIHNVAAYIGGYICKANNSDEDTTEVVIYSVEVLMTYITFIINLIIVTYITDVFLPLHSPILKLGIFIMCFIFIRKYFGGFHASSSFMCMIISIAIPIICLILSHVINFNIYLVIGIYVLSYIIGSRLGTIDNPIKRLSQAQKDRFKRMGLISIELLFLLNIILYYLKFYEASDMMVLAVICGFVNLFFGR